MDKIDEINLQINKLSEEKYKVENRQRQLMNTEEELRDHVQRKARFFEMLEDYWRTGDMVHRVADKKWQLQREEYRVFDLLAEEQSAIRAQVQEFETEEDDLYRIRKIAWEELE